MGKQITNWLPSGYDEHVLLRTVRRGLDDLQWTTHGSHDGRYVYVIRTIQLSDDKTFVVSMDGTTKGTMEVRYSREAEMWQVIFCGDFLASGATKSEAQRIAESLFTSNERN